MTGHRTLLLLRHAKSDWSTDQPDEQRPLSGRGRRDAPAAGRWLAANAPTPDLVVCSTAVRARQTWQLAAAGYDPAPPADYDPRLYAAGAEQLLRVVHSLPGNAGTALLVAHNPGLSDLAALLTGHPQDLKTSSVAVLTWPGDWPTATPGDVTRIAFATPRG